MEKEGKNKKTKTLEKNVSKTIDTKSDTIKETDIKVHENKKNVNSTFKKKIVTASKEKRKPKRKKKKLTQADIKKYPKNELNNVILKIKTNEVKYTIFSTLIILSIFIIIAYTIFSSVQEHISHNILKSGNLYIEFAEKETGLGNIIDLVDAKTYSDSNEVLETYKVTITNDSKEKRKYQVLIEDDTEMIEIDNCSDIFLDRSYLRYNVNNGATMTLNQDDKSPIINGTLKEKEKVTYTIKVWVSNTYLENPHYHGKIVVKQVTDKEDIKKIILEK